MRRGWGQLELAARGGVKGTGGKAMRLDRPLVPAPLCPGVAAVPGGRQMGSRRLLIALVVRALQT